VSCSPYVNRYFVGTYNLHLQGRKSAEQDPRVQQVARQSQIYDPEDRGNTFPRNVGSYTDYTALYPR
jgi:hypothetical protein